MLDATLKSTSLYQFPIERFIYNIPQLRFLHSKRMALRWLFIKLSMNAKKLHDYLFVNEMALEVGNPMPVNGGWSANVYMQMYQGEKVAVKCYRLFQMNSNEDRQAWIRVRYLCRFPNLVWAITYIYFSEQDFYWETLTWRQLDHPNIQRLWGVSHGIAEHEIGMVSNWREHGNIGKYRSNNANLSPAIYHAWVLQYLILLISHWTSCDRLRK